MQWIMVFRLKKSFLVFLWIYNRSTSRSYEGGKETHHGTASNHQGPSHPSVSD